MLIDYDYSLTEQEHAMVRWMLEIPLAKHGVQCKLHTADIPVTSRLAEYASHEVAALVSGLPDKEVVVRRSGRETFPIFEFLLVQGADDVPNCWTYRFTRTFLQFIIGRNF